MIKRKTSIKGVQEETYNAFGDFLTSLLAEQGTHNQLALPTVIDAITLSLNHVGTNFIEAFESEETEFVLKTRKKPAKQSYRVGDVFKIPLGSSFTYGRVTPQYLVYDFYMLKSAKEEPLEDVLNKPIFRLPFLVDDGWLCSGLWQVIGNNIDGLFPFEVQHFKMGNQRTISSESDSSGFIDVTKELVKVSTPLDNLLPPYQTVAPEQALILIEKKLSSIAN